MSGAGLILLASVVSTKAKNGQSRAFFLIITRSNKKQYVSPLFASEKGRLNGQQ